MARQVRSEATRRKLLDAAVDVFSEVGYSAAGRGAIIERAGVTKGALYHHFDSMDALASAIIDEGCATVLDAFRGACPPSSPALEGLIHGTFAAADVLASDKGAGVATQLACALGEFNAAAVGVLTGWLNEVATRVGQAIAEGDLRAELDPEAVAEVIVGGMFGTRLLSQVAAGGEPVGPMTRVWQLLLPGVTADASLPYFGEFLARASLRYRVDVAQQ